RPPPLPSTTLFRSLHGREHLGASSSDAELVGNGPRDGTVTSRSLEVDPVETEELRAVAVDRVDLPPVRIGAMRHPVVPEMLLEASRAHGIHLLLAKLGRLERHVRGEDPELGDHSGRRLTATMAFS